MTCIYVIEARGGPVKIGIATNPQSLLAALRTGTPFPLRLAHVEDPGELDAVTVEKAARAILEAARVYGEWFSVSVDEARKAVQDTVERLRRPPTSVVAAAISCPVITRFQIREARALLGWTSATLASRALLSLEEVTSAQSDKEIRFSGGLQLSAIRKVFEAAGLEFIPENGGRAGVRLRKNAP